MMIWRTIYEIETGRIVECRQEDAASPHLPPEGDLDGIHGCIHAQADPVAQRVVAGVIVDRDAGEVQAEADAAAAFAVRATRYALLRRHVDDVNGLRWSEMPAAERADLRAFRQALLDLPEAGGELPALPVPDDLTRAKRRATARMLSAIDAAVEALAGDVPQAEMLSWASKEAAARAQVAGSASVEDLAMLTAEADVTGETLADLSARIIARADAYRTVTGQIAGLRRVVSAAIAAATTEQEVAAALLPLNALTGD